VLVGDQDRLERLRPLADYRQPSRDLAQAEAGIDKNFRPIGGEKGAVAGTAAPQYRNANADGPLLPLAADSQRATPGP